MCQCIKCLTALLACGAASCYLCSFFPLHYTGGHRCRCRSPPCSDNQRVHHSQIPEHTHPHLNTNAHNTNILSIFQTGLFFPHVTDSKSQMKYPDRLVDFLPTSHCCCSAPWCLPAGKSQRHTDRPQSCRHGSPSPETSRFPEDEVARRTLLLHTQRTEKYYQGSNSHRLATYSCKLFFVYVTCTIQ